MISPLSTGLPSSTSPSNSNDENDENDENDDLLLSDDDDDNDSNNDDRILFSQTGETISHPDGMMGGLTYNLDDLDDLNDDDNDNNDNDDGKNQSLRQDQVKRQPTSSSSLARTASLPPTTIPSILASELSSDFTSENQMKSSRKSFNPSSSSSSSSSSLPPFSTRSLRSVSSLSLKASPDELNDIYDSLSHHGLYPIIVTLTTLYPYGDRIHRLVNHALKEQEGYYDLLDHLHQVRTAIMLSANQTEQEEWKDVAVKLLRKYYLLHSIGIYLHSTQNHLHHHSLSSLSSSSASFPSFEQWFHSNQSVRSLYETITNDRIHQYLSISVEELPHMSMNLAVKPVSGFLNIHTLLLQQKICTQENETIADKMMLSVRSKRPLLGTIFTKSFVSDAGGQ